MLRSVLLVCVLLASLVLHGHSAGLSRRMSLRGNQPTMTTGGDRDESHSSDSDSDGAMAMLNMALPMVKQVLKCEDCKIIAKEAAPRSDGSSYMCHALSEKVPKEMEPMKATLDAFCPSVVSPLLSKYGDKLCTSTHIC